MPASPPGDVSALLGRLCDQAAAAFVPSRPLSVIGIRTGGAVLADRLVAELRRRGFGEVLTGTLDITLYRDDLSEIGPRPLVRPTDIDFDIDGHPLLLVDDVIFTGRSVRAALDQLADFGRPSAVRLAVLVDRGGRELPIQPDFVGQVLDVPPGGRVNVRLAETHDHDLIEIVGGEA